MEQPAFYITDLSSSEHRYRSAHFCRGNSRKRKTRIGLIESGEGSYIYLNKRISVSSGDIVFIPEKVFCYSEWRGSPDIHVLYISFHIHDAAFPYSYSLKKLPSLSPETGTILRDACRLCGGDTGEVLGAYSLVYRFLAQHYSLLTDNQKKLDKDLCKAIDYLNEHWDKDFSVGQMARECAVSESKLYHLFKEQLGQTPVGYLNAVKVNYAMQYLENNTYSVGQVSRMTNFHSESYFRRVFFSITGSTPSKFRRNS